MWSLGNESGYSDAFRESAKRIKELDNSRLIHYEAPDILLTEREKMSLMSFR